MSISFGAIGTQAVGTTSLSIPFPTDIVSFGEMLLCGIVNKYPNNSPVTPDEWTLPANAQGSGGAGSSGSDSGSVFVTVFYKLAAGGEHAGPNLSVSIPSGNSALGFILKYHKSPTGSWGILAANGSSNTPGTSWNATGNVNLNINVDDVVVVFSGINGAGGGGQLSTGMDSQVLTATGVTFGSTNERKDFGTGQGEDCHLIITDHTATAGGPSSAAPNYTGTTLSVAANHSAGASVFVRLFIDSGGEGEGESDFLLSSTYRRRRKRKPVQWR